MYNKKGVKNKKGANFMKIRGKTLVVLPLCIGTQLLKVQTGKKDVLFHPEIKNYK